MHAQYVFTVFIALAASAGTSLAAPVTNLETRGGLQKYNPTSGTPSQPPNIPRAAVVPKKARDLPFVPGVPTSPLATKNFAGKLLIGGVAVTAAVGFGALLFKAISINPLFNHKKRSLNSSVPGVSLSESADAVKEIEKLMVQDPEQAHKLIDELETLGYATGKDLVKLRELADKYAGARSRPTRRNLRDLD
ncbi:hypothetical protein FRC02_007545 [Tulasnella sp. 418]|nr:hypothetical protein FRC02_007545 [Tulasnella sp. 418]